MDLRSFILESKLTNNDIIDHIVSIYYSGKAGMSIPDDLLAVKTRRDAVKYYEKNMVPILPNSEEIIKRNSWDLVSLIGTTEEQLMHRHFIEVNRELKKRKRGHDTLAVFQCTSKKPYSCNEKLGIYTKPFEGMFDVGSMTIPGVILWDHSNYYPYRYEEWRRETEKVSNKIVELRRKSDAVVLNRFVSYILATGYKNVVAVVNHEGYRYALNHIIKHNLLPGVKIYNCFDDKAIKKAQELYPPSFGYPLIKTRFINLIPTRMEFCNALKDIFTDDKSQKIINDMLKELRQLKADKLNESLEPDDYELICEDAPYNYFSDIKKSKLIDNPTPSECVKRWDSREKDYDWDYEYKKSYYTVLDVVLYALGDDVCHDIDKLYEDVFEYLKSHKKQVFKYVFMDKDVDITQDEALEEARKLGICQCHIKQPIGIAQVCKVFGDRKAREKQAYRNNIEKLKNQSK